MKRPGQSTWILIGLVVGTVIGWLWPEVGVSLQPLATIFIRLMLMLVAPLIFSALVVALAGGGPLRAIGSVAWQTLGFAFVYTAVMLGFGLLLGDLFQPGAGIALGEGRETVAAAMPEPFWLRLVPTSVLDAMARNDIIQIVVFSVLFGVAVNLAGDKGTPVLTFCRSLLEVMFKLTNLAMLAAPLGVAGAMAAVVGEHGLSVGESFARLAGATYLGLGVMALVVTPVMLRLARVPLRPFLLAAREPVLIAFSTTSGTAAWPVALENLLKMGLPQTISSFVLFTGTFNLGGSALFIGVAGSFLLQATNTDVSDAGLLAIFVTLYIAGKSVFGPRGSLLALAAALGSFGMDPYLVAAGFALLVGIDPLLDMPRTGVNILGNMTTACLVSRWQGVENIGEPSPSANGSASVPLAGYTRTPGK
jgi:proton glutamate symport protein